MSWRRALLLLALLTPMARAEDDLLDASGRALVAGRHAEAAGQLRELLAREPEGARADRARHRLAFLLDKKLDEPREAAGLYRAVAERGGALAAHARLHLADCLARLDDIAGARAALAELVARHPEHPRAELARRALAGAAQEGLPAGLAGAVDRLGAGAEGDRPPPSDPRPADAPAGPPAPRGGPPEAIPPPPVDELPSVDRPSEGAPPADRPPPPTSPPPAPIEPPSSTAPPSETRPLDLRPDDPRPSAGGRPPAPAPSVGAPPGDRAAPATSPGEQGGDARSVPVEGRVDTPGGAGLPRPTEIGEGAPPSRRSPTLPDDPTYVRQMAEEMVMAAGARTDEERVTVLTEFARRRVAEAGLAAQRGRHETAAELARAYGDVVHELRSVVASLEGPPADRAAAQLSAALQLMARALEGAAAAMRAAGAPDVLSGQVEAASTATRSLDPAALRLPPISGGGVGSGAGGPRTPPIPGRRR